MRDGTCRGREPGLCRGSSEPVGVPGRATRSEGEPMPGEERAVGGGGSSEPLEPGKAVAQLIRNRPEKPPPACPF